MQVELEAGAQDLVVHLGDDSVEEAVANQGALLFLDDVRLVAMADIAQPRLAQINLKRGSTLVLDGAFVVMFDNPVTVDGEAVQGRRQSLEHAGVDVVMTGTGRIQSGRKIPGFSMILR